MSIIVLIVVAIAFFRFIRYYVKRQKINPNTCVTAYCGTMGTGKTAHAVNAIVEEWEKRKTKKQDCIVFSSVGIQLDKKTRSKKLTKSILRGKKKIPLNSIIFIDEVSSYINQYGWKEQQLESLFLKLSRQFANIKWYLTEQSFFSMPVWFRRRTNIVYSFKESKVILNLFLTSDVEVVETQEGFYTKIVKEDEPKHTLIFLGLRKRYDTHAYRDCYEALEEEKLEEWDSLKMPLDAYDKLKEECTKKRNSKKGSVKNEMVEEN